MSVLCVGIGTLYEYDYRSLVDNWIVQTSEMGSSGIRLNAKVQVTLSSSSDMAFLQARVIIN